MPARLRLALLVTGTLALAAIAGVVALAAGERAAPAAGFQGAVRPLGIPPVDFGLRDQDGEPIRLADFRGRPVIVTFQYTTCRDTCPVTTQQIRGALDLLGHDVPVVAVSVDPVNDSADRARRHLLRQHMTGRMDYILGDRRQLRRLWRAYAIQPQGDGFEHSASTVLLDGRGRQRIGYFTSFLTPQALAHDLRLLEAEGSG